MVMWAMSDRAIPRSLRMMEGFGVNTYRLVDAKGARLHQVALAADARHAVDDVGRGGQDRRRRSRLPSPRSSPRSRAARSPSWSSRSSRFRRPRPRASFDILDATKLIPEEVFPLSADRQDGARSLARQLLRRDRAGRVSSRPPRARHRVLRRSAAAGPDLLVHRHPAEAARRPQLPRARDQPAEVPDAQLPARWHGADAVDKGRTNYEPNRLAPNGPRETPAGFASFPGSMPGQGPPALGDVRRSLQPGADVLAVDDAARAAPHRQRVHVRAIEGRDHRDPDAQARSPEGDRQGARRDRRDNMGMQGRPTRSARARAERHAAVAGAVHPRRRRSRRSRAARSAC